VSPGRAALALAGLLIWLALPRAAPRLAPCPEPAERVGVAGHTLSVACEGGPPLRGPARRLFGLPLDPNREDAAALEALPGIGPARAAAIVRERLRRPFASVAGIGPRTLARIAPWLAVGEESLGSAAEPALGPSLAAPGSGGR
jgi:hypothetical protein